ncbi:MAG: hypothetical protein KGI50_06280 [Patescibacteria group bacterium]|nr:hypothetical protein [Patescibacteria group bacterium]MDE2438931.1 hypothetical protein [Patescibacteria group bacterium]
MKKQKRLQGGLDAGTVRFTKKIGDARIARDLLGDKAGDTRLSFLISYNQDKKTLIFDPMLDQYGGCRARYTAMRSKSPHVSLGNFLKTIGRSTEDLPQGSYPAEVLNGKIVVKIKFETNGH